METLAHHEHHEMSGMERTAIGGSSVEALGGAAAVVLAILGLAQVEPRIMISVSAIAVGAALIFDGAAIAAEWSRILSHNGNGSLSSAELGGGVNAQIGGGAAAVVLGVLALLNLAPVTLTAIASIVLGTTLVFSSGVTTRLNSLKIEASGDHESAKLVAREASTASSGTEVMVGLAAVVLGILALVGFAQTTLILVAMLALGVAVLLIGSTVIGKLLPFVST